MQWFCEGAGLEPGGASRLGGEWISGQGLNRAPGGGHCGATACGSTWPGPRLRGTGGSARQSRWDALASPRVRGASGRFPNPDHQLGVSTWLDARWASWAWAWRGPWFGIANQRDQVYAIEEPHATVLISRSGESRGLLMHARLRTMRGQPGGTGPGGSIWRLRLT